MNCSALPRKVRKVRKQPTRSDFGFNNNMFSICTERPLTPPLSPAGGEGGLWPGEGDLYYIESKLV